MENAKSARRGSQIRINEKQKSERIERYTISDPESFRMVTGGGHEIAGMYFLYELDVLVDLAHAVSRDFFGRPQRYKDFDAPDLARRIATLHTRYGCDERFLSRSQRAALFAPYFDDTDGSFRSFRDGLLTAAATYSEWSQATGLEMQRAAVCSAHTAFRVQLGRYSGASLEWSRNQALPYLTDEVAYPILRDRGVCSVFGVYQPPGEAWPYREDAEGGEVVEEICRQLAPGPELSLTRHAFSRRQQVALRGAEALAAILDFASENDDTGALETLITKCYTWYTAMRDTTGRTPAPSEQSATDLADRLNGRATAVSSLLDR